MRRVVGRPFARAVLNAMADCRPRPDFEVSDWLWSIAFDQTYVRKSGASTGTTRYRAVQTVDERGNPVVPDRLVYINGQDYAAPAFHLPPAVATLISRVGPYTQDFRRLLPHLDPTRMDRVMDDLLVRTATLLTGVVTGLGAPTRDVVASLLSRPNVDPGGPTYTTFLPCLLRCNTASYVDMMRIIGWMHAYIGGIPLVLHVIGDGQSVLRMRDLKRLRPRWYRHVLVSNGHFHSSVHFSFAAIRHWWKPLLCVCCDLLGKDLVSPDMKNLEGNAAQHAYEALAVVACAILVYLLRHVQSPPPWLLLTNPVLYVSLLEHAGGMVLVQFLRHAGLPAIFWKRAARTTDGPLVDDLHGLALHLFRAMHKTSSSQISLLHLVSVFGVHPALRRYVQQRAFVSVTGNVGATVYADQAVEAQNEEQKSRGIGRLLLAMLSFTRLLQPLMHVNRAWRQWCGAVDEGDHGFRVGMLNEVEVLVELFLRKCGTDLRRASPYNGFHHTGNPIDILSPALATPDIRNWEWKWRVSYGQTHGERTESRETWDEWAERHIRDHSFPY